VLTAIELDLLSVITQKPITNVLTCHIFSNFERCGDLGVMCIAESFFNPAYKRRVVCLCTTFLLRVNGAHDAFFEWCQQS
jgi:hypothetical protein